MKNLKPFIFGMLTTAIIGSFAITALANTGVLTVQVTPVKVMVNNQEFKPKDARGNDALVFNYGGTVYAPLRALAESYGLEVGWDQEKQMASVGKSTNSKNTTDSNTNENKTEDAENESDPQTDPPAQPEQTNNTNSANTAWTQEENQKYLDFKNMWNIEYIKTNTSDIPTIGDRDIYHCLPKENSNSINFIKAMSKEIRNMYIERLMNELRKDNGILLFIRDGNEKDSNYLYPSSIFKNGTVWFGN
jgi:hypothetical protein